MGESSACLMRSFSQPSPTSSDEKQGNPIQRALTASISFGRFMSESLDWGKWSAFTHNRYLEDVEKYSKPGSVAEKKAYFEAHFKRRRAAALLEQQNVEASNFLETNNDDEDKTSSSLGFEQSDIYLVSGAKEEEVRSSSPPVPVGQNGNFESSIERTSDEIEKATEPLVTVEKSVGLENSLETDGCFGDIVSKIEDKLCNKDNSSPINSSSSEKKPEVSSSKLLTDGGASDCASPVKTIKPVHLKNSEKTPASSSKAMDSSNKRRSYTTSLHMSINFAPCSGSIRKVTSPKIEKSKTVRVPAKKYKNSIPQTETRASTNDGLFKNHLATPQAENSRIVRLHGDSISRVRTLGEKVQSLSSNYSKPSNSSGIKAKVPTVPSSFTFKSEERAIRRREFFQMLEQKTKLNETEKHQIHAKPQVKTRDTIKDLRNSIAVETTKNAEFPSRKVKARDTIKDLRNSIAVETTKNAEFPSRKVKARDTKDLCNSIAVETTKNTEFPSRKVPSVRSCIEKIEERAAAFRIQDNDSRPPWRLSSRTEGRKDFTRKNSRAPSYSTKGFKKNSANENSSPNIQF